MMSRKAGYRKPRPKKLAERRDPLALTAAPCCGRCTFWGAPVDPGADPFGECGRTFVVTRRIQRVEAGTILSRQEIDNMDFPDSVLEPVRTRSWAPSCSLYAARTGTIAAAQESGTGERVDQLRLMEEPERYVA